MNDLQDDTEIETKRFGWPVDPYRLYLVIKNRGYWLIVNLVIGFVIGGVVAKTMIPREYEASTIFILSPEYTDMRSQLEVQSLADAILLPDNLREAYQRLNLRMRIREFAKHITTDLNLRRSGLLKVSVTWPKVDEAAEVANTVADVFIDYQKQQLELVNQETVDDLRADLDVALTRLSNSRQVFDTLRREKGFTDLEAETRIAIEDASRARFEADQIASEARGLGNTLDQFQSSVRESSNAELSGRWGDYAEELTYLRSELAQAQSRLELALDRLPPEHPTIEALRIQIEKLEEQLPAERGGRSMSSVRQAYAAVLNRQQTLESTATNAEVRLKELARDNSEAATVLMEIRLAERHVEELESRLQSARDQARNPPLMFRLLEKAKRPSTAKSIRKPVVVGFGVGFMFITALVLFVSANKGLRVFTANEAAFWSGFPVIGTSVWPNDPDKLESLIREFDDYMPTASGSTLIVALSEDESERKWAHRLAQSLNQLNAFRRNAESIGETSVESKGKGDENPASTAIEQGPISNQERMAFEGLETTYAAWTGPISGPALRGAARTADRIMVAVSSGKVSLLPLIRLSSRLGRSDGIGLLLLGQDKTHRDLPDRVGPLKDFWNFKRMSK